MIDVVKGSATRVLGFQDLLSEHESLFYGFLGGEPERMWLERKELRDAGVVARQIRLLYPACEFLREINARLAQRMKADEDLAATLLYAGAQNANLTAVVGPRMEEAQDTQDWFISKSESALLQWVEGVHGPSGLEYAQMRRLENMIQRLAWVFEHPKAFKLASQVALMENIDVIADRLADQPALRTEAYLTAPALRFQQDPTMEWHPSRSEHLFIVEPRLDHLGDLWAWNFGG